MDEKPAQAIYYSVFPVHKTPYCVWSYDLRKDNLEFLRSIDPLFFNYQADVHGSRVKDETEKQAAIALRLAYLHGLETLFTLLAGTLQAPEATFAWIPKCRPLDLRSAVADIHSKNQDLLRTLVVQEVSWRGLSELINNFKVPDGTPDPVETFAKVWNHLASEFLSDNNRLEFNCIKHGFRVNFGGFTSIQFKPQEGVPTEFKGSAFGTQFYESSDIPNTPSGNFTLRWRAINWSPQILVDSLAAISLSINNILSFLRVANGDDPATAQVHYPASGDLVSAVTKSDIRVYSLQYTRDVPAQHIKAFLTQAEMLKLIRGKAQIGR